LNASSIAATRLRAKDVDRRSMAWPDWSKKEVGSEPTSYSSRKENDSLAQIGSSCPTLT